MGPPAPAPAPDPAPQPEPVVDAAHPQHPVAPFPYAEEEVEYTNARSGLKLAGTLSVPPSAGPHPAVVLISGSGAQDRDSTVFGHRPFAVLADHFARRGLAVLRVDDRGVGGSERGGDDVTSEDFATDVEAGVAFLRARPDVDGSRIALVGHSEGGAIAPMVAARDPEISGIVLLAGPGVPGQQLLLSQARALLEAQGMPDGVVESAVMQQAKVLQALAESESVEEARNRVIETAGVETEAVRKAVEAQVVPWTLFFVKHDPRGPLAEVRCPVLALGGTLDTQVVSSENLPAIENALRTAGNTDVEVVELKGLNHLFQPAKTGAPEEYESSTVTFDEDALQRVGTWLEARLLQN